MSGLRRWSRPRWQNCRERRYYRAILAGDERDGTGERKRFERAKNGTAKQGDGEGRDAFLQEDRVKKKETEARDRVAAGVERGAPSCGDECEAGADASDYNLRSRGTGAAG